MRLKHNKRYHRKKHYINCDLSNEYYKWNQVSQVYTMQYFCLYYLLLSCISEWEKFDDDNNILRLLITKILSWLSLYIYLNSKQIKL